MVDKLKKKQAPTTAKNTFPGHQASKINLTIERMDSQFFTSPMKKRTERKLEELSDQMKELTPRTVFFYVNLFNKNKIKVINSKIPVYWAH